jgi:hypothetical protein
MGLVFLQANDGHSGELSGGRVRLTYLSSYDKKGNPAPPGKPAGEDGLGDMVMDPSAPGQQGFDSLDSTLNEIKKVETDKGTLKLKLAQAVYLFPIYLPPFTPIEGPQARRFANPYTRLFVRYPGLEDSKLGTEA